MKYIDFIITNPKHHLEIILPVIRQLQQHAIPCRIISFCEFRRMQTPVDMLKAERIPVVVMPGFKRKGQNTSAGAALGVGGSWKRKMLYKVVWTMMLAKPVRQFLKDSAKIVILNDAAFPTSYVLNLVKKKKLPIYMMQEGIRFRLPAEKNYDAYGSSGMDVLFSWGETSKEFFSGIAKPHTKVLAAGCPRFDKLNVSTESRLEEVKNKFYQSSHNILFASNPIDDQGYCNKAEKMDMFRKFLQRLNGMDSIGNNACVHLRLHNRENVEDYRAVWESLDLKYKVRLSAEEGLYDAILLSDAIVILSSTVGLECAMLGKRFGAIKLFDHGYAGDYVKHGVAVGLDVDNAAGFEAGMSELLSSKGDTKEYVDKTLSNYKQAGAYIANVLMS